MSELYDVVIAGGGVIGSAVACHLAMDADFTGSILVLEPDPTYAKAASALSASGIRQQFSCPVNIAISLYGIDFLRDSANLLGIDDDRPDVGLNEGGYLYLATAAGADGLRRNHAAQTALGADIALLDPPALAARFPWLSCDDIALGSLGMTGEGWFDGYALLQAFRRRARAAGVIYRVGRAAELTRRGSRIETIGLSDGTRISCGTFANCGGASGARAIAAMAGVSIPVYARKRSVFTFTTEKPATPCPLVIDPSGVWLRPEGRAFICGWSPQDDGTPDAEDFDVDWPLFEERLWPALAARSRIFENLRPGRAWAGHYDMNDFDQNALVGPMGDIDNAFIAAGFSGHGLQQSPAVGRGLSERIIHGAYRTLDLTPLGFDRIAAQRPLIERCVI